MCLRWIQKQGQSETRQVAGRTTTTHHGSPGRIPVKDNDTVRPRDPQGFPHDCHFPTGIFAVLLLCDAVPCYKTT